MIVLLCYIDNILQRYCLLVKKTWSSLISTARLLFEIDLKQLLKGVNKLVQHHIAVALHSVLSKVIANIYDLIPGINSLYTNN